MSQTDAVQLLQSESSSHASLLHSPVTGVSSPNLTYLPYSFVYPLPLSLTFVASDVTTLSDGTPRLPPSTCCTGASPSNVTNQLPVLTPPDSSSTTITSAAILTNSRPYASRSPLGVPSITSPPSPFRSRQHPRPLWQWQC